MNFNQAPVLYNEQGNIRKVGFEIEFGNLRLQEVADLIIRLYGGRVETVNRFHLEVVDTEIGKFGLKVDLTLLHEGKYQKILHFLGLPLADISIGSQSVESHLENLLESAVTINIPYEITVPPVPMNELEKAEKLRNGLQEMNAKGTRASLLYTFATHINPELPDSRVETLLTYLRSFMVLYPWLEKISDIDFARQHFTFFFNPFPAEYVRLVFDESYAPDHEKFISDYHQYNPDRNRPLDFYPILAWIRPEQVGQLQNLGNVRSRPTLHYRLPNSLVDDPGWSFATEWNRWNHVEHLTAQPDLLKKFMRDYLAMEARNLAGFNNVWINKVEEWIDGTLGQA